MTLSLVPLLALLVSTGGVASALEPSTNFSQIAPAFPAATPEELSSAASASSSTLSSGSGAVFDASDPFYIPPADLPPEPGTLIRSQPAPHLLNLTGPALPGSASKILYTSTTTHGDPVAVSGYMIEPARAWEGEGPVPTVVFAPGTRGAADSCAPSRATALTGTADPAGQTVNLNYELPFHYAASLYGMRVVVTDYIGLGTPGTHTYVHSTEQARAVLDAARAGLKAAGVPHDSPVGFWGYSQGGGATAAAAEQVATYAPELNVKGTYAGAPPADLPAVMSAVDGSSIAGVLGYAIAGYADRYPYFEELLHAEVNDEGRYFLEENANSCIIDSVLRWAMTDSRTLTRTGESLAEITARIPEINEILARESLGTSAPQAPIMLGSSVADDIIPNSQVVELGRTYCSQGASTYYNGADVSSATSSLPYAVDHALGMFLDTPESMNFLIDRFNGVPAPVNCGTF